MFSLPFKLCMTLRRDYFTNILKRKESIMGAYKNPLIDETFFDGIKDNVIKDGSANYQKYKNVYFAFIDVLGFKRNFEREERKEKETRGGKYKEVFEYYFQIMNNLPNAQNQKEILMYAGQTSDSLYFYTDRIDLLVQFMQIYSYFSVYAMERDVFFRGGIAKGELYISKKEYQFYGSSVINAYLLESEVAKLPRIIIDKNTYTDVKKEISGEKLVCKDEQAKRYYMRPFVYFESNLQWNMPFSLEDPDRQLYKPEVEKIKEIIESNIDKFEYENNNYQKYAFLKSELQKVIKGEKKWQ